MLLILVRKLEILRKSVSKSSVIRKAYEIKSPQALKPIFKATNN